MTPRHARAVILPFLGLSAILGCGSGGGTTTGGGGTTSHTTSQSGGTGGTGGTGIIITGTGGDSGCSSGIICGAGVCCPAGSECVVDQCFPACASQVRCGADNSVCCAASELCLGETCSAATTPCTDYADCADDEFCEPTLGKCVPQVPGAPLCEYKPPVGSLTPTIEWSWTSSTIRPAAVQVINMPVVIDLENDGHPDVVIVTSEDYTALNGIAYLRALNGKDGTEKWADTADVYKDAYRVNSRGTPAAADLDGDGKVEIVTPRSAGGLIAFNGDGSFRWASKQKDGVTAYSKDFASATVAIADLDGDGSPEIVAGGVVFDARGKLIADNGVFGGSHDAGYGAVSIVADVNGDGIQEVITGRSAFDVDASGVHTLWDNGQSDGYPAIADLDGDGKPEIVVVSNSKVRVQDGLTGAVLATLPFPNGITGAGGPPTIADFDADGVPEFSTAGGNGYMVFKYAPATHTINLVWSSVTQDLSSNRTGSSVFDFEGDGAAEVVYGDECYFRIYSGKDGKVLFQTPSSSATIHEYPVIADVDGDNNTEIIVVSNDLHHTNPLATCPQWSASDKPRHGVFVYGDASDKWVRTRRVWNQHAYHLTNIGADGKVPQHEPVSWVVPPGLNNYRQSSQGSGVYNAPDLKVSLAAGLGSCPLVHLDALVQNHGSLGVAAGVEVSFFAGTSPNGTLITSAKTTKALLPGQYEVLSADYAVPQVGAPYAFYVVVDGDMAGQGSVSECLEDNNAGAVSSVVCPLVQ